MEHASSARRDSGLRVLGLGIAVVSIVVWFRIVSFRAIGNSLLGLVEHFRENDFRWFLFSVQTYCAPFLTPAFSPIVVTLALFGLCFVFRSPREMSRRWFGSPESIGLAIFVVFCEFLMLDLFLQWHLLVGTIQRLRFAAGMPDQIFDHRERFGVAFWDRFLVDWGTRPTLFRELPGVVFFAGYFALGLYAGFALTRGRGHIGTWVGAVLLSAWLATPSLPFEAIVPSAVVLIAVVWAVAARFRPNRPADAKSSVLRGLAMGVLLMVALLDPLEWTLTFGFGVRKIFDVSFEYGIWL